MALRLLPVVNGTGLRLILDTSISRTEEGMQESDITVCQISDKTFSSIRLQNLWCQCPCLGLGPFLFSCSGNLNMNINTKINIEMTMNLDMNVNIDMNINMNVNLNKSMNINIT